MNLYKDSPLFTQGSLLAVRQLLQTYDLSAKKSWGQNFLVDDGAYRAIVDGCQLSSEDLVVEIGAGLGTLSARILQTGASLIAVEREHDMCQVLQKELSSHPKFTLRQENALETDFSQLSQQSQKPMIVVGNLPYQIATPLMFRVLESRSLIRTIVFMLQAEVADRLVALPDTEHYGALSAQVQMLAQVKKIRKVGPGGFIPQPRVDSAIVRLTPYPKTRVPVKDIQSYRRVVQAAFSMRRKILRNTLRSLCFERTQHLLEKAQIDPQRRGETLSIEEFARLSDLFYSDFVESSENRNGSSCESLTNSNPS